MKKVGSILLVMLMVFVSSLEGVHSIAPSEVDQIDAIGNSLKLETLASNDLEIIDGAANEYSVISEIDPEFQIGSAGTVTEVISEMVSEHGDARLCDIYLDGKPVAYTVRIDTVLVEYSLSPSPYAVYFNGVYSNELGYNHSEYFIVESGEIIYLHQNGTVDSGSTELELSSSVVPLASPANVTIPGVSHNLQGQKNCIAAALSNVLWYWGENGYPTLRLGSWQSLLDAIHTRFGGSFANNRVHIVADAYARSRRSDYRIGGYVHWSPTPNQVQLEINAGRPCMVGFKRGSDYSDSVGHMTMCYGYYWIGSNFYLRLADGHKSHRVVKLWTSYNDCVITIRPSIYVGGHEPAGWGGELNE